MLSPSEIMIVYGVSENKEMHRFFVETGWLQDKKRRNPLWIASIFNAADTGFCKKR